MIDDSVGNSVDSANIPGEKDRNRAAVLSERGAHPTRQTAFSEQNGTQQNYNLLVLLFSLLVGNAELGEDGQPSEDLEAKMTMLGEVASAFGIEHADFLQTTNRVLSGQISPSRAAELTTASIDPSNVDWSRASNIRMSDLITNDNTDTLLHPDLVRRMESDPQVRQMVQWTLDAAEREGLDGNLFANQLWQESRYNPQAVSPAGARGVGQFMPHHLGKWGLESQSDFFDPKTSIDASARFMRHLTDRMGAQELALVAYNGGERAIDYADRNVTGDGVTIEQWMQFMHEERMEKGEGAAHLWRNETFGYIQKIDSTYWDRDLLARAEQNLPTDRQEAFNNGGVEQVASSAPNPSAQFGQGVDQVALAEGEAGMSPEENIPGTAPTAGIGSKA